MKYNSTDLEWLVEGHCVVKILPYFAYFTIHGILPYKRNTVGVSLYYTV